MGLPDENAQGFDVADAAREDDRLVVSGARLAKLGGWAVCGDVFEVSHEEGVELLGCPSVPKTFDEAFAAFELSARLSLRDAADLCLREGRPFELEVARPHGDQKLWLRVLGEAVNDGVIVGMRGAIQDVSERKAVEAVLRVSDARFRLLARATNDAAYEVDFVANKLIWAEGYHTLLGSEDTVLPRDPDCLDHVHPDDRDAVVDSLRTAIAGTDERWMHEYRLLHVDGRVIWVLERAQILRDASGRAIRMVGGVSDLTEKRAMAERMRDQAALLDKANEAISVRDIDGVVTYWNGKAEHLYGLSADDVSRRRVPSFFRKEAVYRDALHVLLADGEWRGDFEIDTFDRGVRIVHAHWTLVRGVGDKPSSVFAIETDITESRRAESQMLRSQRLESLGTLAGGVAHDLNNLLSPILMTVSYLRQTAISPELDQDLAMIEACAERGGQLVKRLVDFARGSVGEAQPIKLSVATKELAQIVSDTFPKNIRFVLDTDEERWGIVADESQIHQLLLNLCVNARDAMPTGGTLTVAIGATVFDEGLLASEPGCAPGPYAVLRVEDTGEGMPPKVLERIFEPFFTTRAHGHGTGLGLSTVHSIVKGLKGFVHVYSEVGLGTRFKVCIPAHLSEADTMPTRLQSSVRRGRGELILVVDDEHAMREAGRRTLERSGYRVITAAHGVEAVTQFAQHRADVALVLTDMVMPIMDGPATVVALRALEPAVKIVVTSGLGSGGTQARVRELGVDGFVPKPFTAEPLLEAIARALDTP